MFDKYKLKRKEDGPRLPFGIGNRVHVATFDFVAVTPLEECVTRVAALEDLRDLDAWVPATRVNLDQIDTHTYAFIIRENDPAPVELRGYMNRLDDGTTYVSGRASAKVYLQGAEFGFLLSLIFGLAVFVGVFVLFLFGPPFGLFVWFYWRGARKERDRLVAVVKDTLSHRGH